MAVRTVHCVGHSRVIAESPDGRNFTVYRNRDQVGSLAKVRNGYKAYCGRAGLLGVFTSLKEAALVVAGL